MVCAHVRAQFPEKAIPKFTLLASRGSSLSVHGDGSSVRSYLYVEDVAEAFDRVLHKGVTGSVSMQAHSRQALLHMIDYCICLWFGAIHYRQLPAGKPISATDITQQKASRLDFACGRGWRLLANMQVKHPLHASACWHACREMMHVCRSEAMTHAVSAYLCNQDGDVVAMASCLVLNLQR